MVSIIVPVYNAAAYLEKTIRMVEEQTFQDWELLLVDDCSEDESRQIICKYKEKHPDERIRLICQEKNQGAAAARNRGLKEAKGRYIAFLDADDVWLREKLEKELSFMQNKGAAFVFSAYEFGDEEARGTGRIVTVPERITYRQALSRTVIFTSTVLLDREKIPDRLIRMPDVCSEDSATWWQILRNGYEAQGLNEVLVIYRRPGRSLSSNKLTAIRRIWFLYRKVEELPLIQSCVCFIGWAFRATLRRI
ncbi:MAG: glycosyltransferase family 2 protein [Lachnospiraceae bacterium]|nr:glycosyltransferase family 2 protein [Lachnospiraceae bacterium]